MRITDLTSSYLEYLKTGDLAAYERALPELFAHYFEFWGDRGVFGRALTAEETSARKELVGRHLATIEARFRASGLDASDEEVILFVGQGWTNGHACELGGRFVTWLPVEGYKTDSQVEVFVAHELAHALHYARRPEFYFHNREEKENFGRLLITEGLATLVSERAMGLTEDEALWADYVTADEAAAWRRRCEEGAADLARHALDKFSSSADNAAFYTGDMNDVLRSRGGYWLGREVAMKATDRLKLRAWQDLLTVPRDAFEKAAKEILEEMAR